MTFHFQEDLLRELYSIEGWIKNRDHLQQFLFVSLNWHMSSTHYEHFSTEKLLVLQLTSLRIQPQYFKQVNARYHSLRRSQSQHCQSSWNTFSRSTASAWKQLDFHLDPLDDVCAENQWRRPPLAIDPHIYYIDTHGALLNALNRCRDGLLEADL